jgi:hypothetical protein
MGFMINTNLNSSTSFTYNSPRIAYVCDPHVSAINYNSSNCCWPTWSKLLRIFQNIFVCRAVCIFYCFLRVRPEERLQKYHTNISLKLTLHIYIAFLSCFYTDGKEKQKG